MTPLVVVLIVVAVAGWLAWGATYQYLRTVRSRGAEQGELPAVRALRQELEAAGRREQALIGGNQALQRRLDDAEDEARHYREALKVANIHSAALEAKKEQE